MTNEGTGSGRFSLISQNTNQGYHFNNLKCIYHNGRLKTKPHFCTFGPLNDNWQKSHRCDLKKKKKKVSDQKKPICFFTDFDPIVPQKIKIPEKTDKRYFWSLNVFRYFRTHEPPLWTKSRLLVKKLKEQINFWIRK